MADYSNFKDKEGPQNPNAGKRTNDRVGGYTGATWDAANGAGTMPTNPDAVIEGKQYDGGAWGGYSGTVHRDGSGNPYMNPFESGRQADVDRYQGKGAAAAARPAYQLDYGLAKQDMMKAYEAREQQKQAAGLLRSGAMGGQPSAAEIGGNAAMDTSLRSSLAAQGAGRGIAGTAAAGARGYAGAQGGAGIASHFAGQRMGEIGRDRGGFAGTAAAMRGQDYASQAMAQQRAKAQAASEIGQRELNQRGQLGYESMAWDVNKAAQDNALAQQETAAGIYENALARDVRGDARTDKLIGAGTNAAGSAIGTWLDGSGGKKKDEDYP